MSLTSELANPRSPVRRFIDARFTSLDWAQQDIRSLFLGTETLPPSTSTHPNVLGTAIDLRICFYFQPVRIEHRVYRGIRQLVRILGPGSILTTPFAQLHRQFRALETVGRVLDNDTEEWVCRFCLVSALFESVMRRLAVDPLLRTVDWHAVTGDGLLAIVPQAWVDDVRAQSGLFAERCSDLFGQSTTINPDFRGGISVFGADADLIIGGRLFEIKATKNPRFDRQWLYQLIGYLLLDTDDEHGITGLGLYFPRRGRRIEWTVTDVLTQSGAFDHGTLPFLRRAFGETSASRSD